MLRLLNKDIILERSELLYEAVITSEQLENDFELTRGEWSVQDGWLTGFMEIKRTVALLLVVLSSILLVSCDADAGLFVNDGTYYYVASSEKFWSSDYEEIEEAIDPYLYLSLEDNSFALGMASVISHAEYGTFKIEDNKLIAISQSTTYIFEIASKNKLILIKNGDIEYSEKVEFIFEEP